MSSYPPPPNAPDVLPGEDASDYAFRKAEAAIADAARLPEWVLLAEIARRQRHGRAAAPLVESAMASGRFVHVTTYHDGPGAPIRASLLFHSAAEATECARVLTDARKPQ